MNIPDKAVEAAVAHFKGEHLVWPHEGVSAGDYESKSIGTLSEVINEVLEAAAPFIRAEALRDEAERIHRNGLGKPTNDEWFARQWAMQHLARRATDLDPS